MSQAAVTTGFFGKLPSRGDFVRAGLPAAFVTPWDAWLQAVLPESRAALGQDWDAAWLEAPVWRFALEPGLCGPGGVLGLWMPSVDSIGRAFPLTIAAVFEGPAQADEGWLDAAEACGRQALADDLDPAALTACVPDPTGQDPAASGWWSDGSPRVPPSSLPGGLPDGPAFVGMLSQLP